METVYSTAEAILLTYGSQGTLLHSHHRPPDTCQTSTCPGDVTERPKEQISQGS